MNANTQRCDVNPWLVEEPSPDASKKQRQRLEKMGVPGRPAAALAPPAFHETRGVEAARAWLATKAGVLVLSGTVGSGKSVAAAWALENNIRTDTFRVRNYDGGSETLTQQRRLSGRWVAAAELIEASDFEYEFWDPLRTVDLLVIDEAGPERIDTKGRALANFSGLLRARYDNARRTIVTTNLPPAEWLRLYGAADGGRLRDRLREAEADFGRSPLVTVAGASLRGRTETASPQAET
jgi:hypothetical protein